MNIDLQATVSLDGFIADINGSEDDFSYNNWISVLKLYKKYDAILWGRKTYEAVKGWGEDYLSSLDGLNIIVLSHNKIEDGRVIGVTSLKEIKKLGFKKILICGGQQLYNLALKDLNIKNFIFNINFFSLKNGIEFPKIERKLTLVKVIEKHKEFIQVKLH